MENPLAESQSAEALNAEAVASEARQKASLSQIQALMEENQKQTTKILAQAIQDAFGEKTNSGRFIDTSRIPLICQALLGMQDDIKDIKQGMVSKDEFNIVRYIVFGAVIILLIAAFGLIITHSIPGSQVALP